MERSSLAMLRNVGPAALADFAVLGITDVEQLAGQEADALYVRLCGLTGARHDPCAHDVFTAAIHEARTGEALDWWAFTPARKARQAAGAFPAIAAGGQEASCMSTMPPSPETRLTPRAAPTNFQTGSSESAGS